MCGIGGSLNEKRSSEVRDISFRQESEAGSSVSSRLTSSLGGSCATDANIRRVEYARFGRLMGIDANRFHPHEAARCECFAQDGLEFRLASARTVVDRHERQHAGREPGRTVL